MNQIEIHIATPFTKQQNFSLVKIESTSKRFQCRHKYVIILDVYFMSLTHYHTKPHFDALKIYSYGKHCKKSKNCLLQANSPFLTDFFTLYGTYFSL